MIYITLDRMKNKLLREIIHQTKNVNPVNASKKKSNKMKEMIRKIDIFSSENLCEELR